MKENLENVLDNAKMVTRLTQIRYFKDIAFVCLGIGMATVGLKSFLLPNDILDGGAMGVSLLISKVTGLQLSYILVFVSAPFIIVGARLISYEFAIKSTLAILGLSLVLYSVSLPPVTEDELLIAAFGGMFLGAGIGFAIRGGAVIDGTEVMAISVSRRSSLTVGDFVALFNVTLFLVAISVVSIETVMYSMLTYLAASKTVDFVLNGIEEYIGVFIVSDKSTEIKESIIENLKRGVTVFKSEQGYGHTGLSNGNDNTVLYCVVTQLEVTKLLLEVEKVDKNAFITQHTIKEIRGGKVKRRPLH